MKYTLKKPVQLGEGEPVTELVFREELVSGDFRGLKVNSLSDPLMDDLLKIAGRLCAQPDVVMGKLGMLDLSEVIGIVGGFLQAGQETGIAP